MGGKKKIVEKGVKEFNITGNLQEPKTPQPQKKKDEAEIDMINLKDVGSVNAVLNKKKSSDIEVLRMMGIPVIDDPPKPKVRSVKKKPKL